MLDSELRGILTPVILINRAMTIRFSKIILGAFFVVIGFVLIPGFASSDQDPSRLWLQDQANNSSQMDATDLSDQQIEEELARIQAAFEEDEVLEEFIPDDPLSADMAVPFPADI